MKSDFSSPQRQSLVGIVVMFADTLQGTVRAFWPILLIFLFKINDRNRLFIFLGVGVLFAITAIIAYLKYYNFTFFLDDDNDEFVISNGIINKSRVAIPLDKIQQVNINQSLIQKIIGVHALEVDTAGSSKKEVTIKAIPHSLALSLKDRLMETKRAKVDVGVTADVAMEQPAETKPFIKISFGSLLKTGVTSNYARSFAILFAFVITVYQNVEDYLSATGNADNPFAEYLDTKVLLRFTLVIIIGVMLLVLVINLTRTILRYFDFKITRQKDSLLLSYGLLNTKNTIIRPERIQMLAVGRNFFQKKMDIQDIRIRQASNMDSNNKQQINAAIEIPGCNTPEKNTLLEFLLGHVPERGEELRPNIRKVILNVLRLLVIPLGIYYLYAAYISPELFDYKSFAYVYLVFISFMIYFGFRNSRLYVADDFIIKQSGAWDIDNEFLAPHKIQAVAVTQYFWQKSADIGSVKLYTAGGNLHFSTTNYTKIKEYTNYWLYQIETTDKNWM